MPRSENGQIVIYLLLGILILASFMFVGGFKYKPTKYQKEVKEGHADSDVIKVPIRSSQANLQLEPLMFCKRVEGDIPVCYPQNKGLCCQPAWAKVKCVNKQCVGIDTSNGEGAWIESYAQQAGVSVCEWLENPTNYPGGGHAGFPVSQWCNDCEHQDGFLCWGKPVVLLYPTEPTYVDVKVQTTGEIYISDPLYPPGGWKDVLAKPDGELFYQGKSYGELFYESKVKNYGTPKNGLIFHKNELETKLAKLLYDLGLDYSKHEIPEFMDFWLPKLKALNSEYIYVSLIPQDVKERNDKVIITPKPDTFIEVIVYFKPLDKPTDVEPLKIGTRPARVGFTAVEWGGTIDK